MSENFTILFDESNGCIVSSMNYLRIDDYIEELSMELKNSSYTGEVLFDLLLSNGFTKNRFVKIYFENNKFDYNSINILNPEQQLVKNRNEYYRNFPDNVKNNGILTKSQSFLILKGKDLSHKNI